MTARIVIAGTGSGVGKTTVTVALARALQARGLRVALFKCGPDYLDPTYHARATHAPSHNLDGWMMGRTAVADTFANAARDADVALLEGVMGLFDGASPTGDEGSTAEIAKWLSAPVVLVVDAGGMARSIAAVARGFATFDPNLQLAGVIANRVGSRGHLDLLRRALTDPPIVGGLPRDAEHAFAERHLGLRTADDSAVPDALLDHWGALATGWFSLDQLLAIARAAPPIEASPRPIATSASRRCRIGIARDEALHFYYEGNLRALEDAGAELVPFSPVRDARLPDMDGLYLGGGYPEVHAPAIAANTPMRAAIASFGGPIYAECGGLMLLSKAIVTTDGARHEMVGLVPGEAHMKSSLVSLGYVEVELLADSVVGEKGTRFRGHQFRYSELVGEGEVERAYSVRKRRGDEASREGYVAKNVLASYVHAHWASNPRIPKAFVERCVRERQERA